VTDVITTWAEVLGLLAIAAGVGWQVRQVAPLGVALIVFGAVILCMSAMLAALARKRGGSG
jgi:hypothetical protein